jgi:hypothetical protein
MMLMQVSKHIISAFDIAKSKHQEEESKWISLSYDLIGSTAIVMLAFSIQRAGDFDLLLRCMEDEAAIANSTSGPHGVDFAFHYQKMISEMWVSNCYEFLRTIKQRETEQDAAGLQGQRRSRAPEFATLFADLELLRMPMDKHEIAKDKQLQAPLVMQRSPPKGDDTDRYIYDSDDPTRSHIMPTGISERGSVTWQVLDHRSGRQYWVDRRDIGDRLLALVDVT